MKKVLILMLVLCMATVSNAVVLTVGADGLGDASHAGTEADPINVGETIHIAIELNFLPYYGVGTTSAYDGYITDALDVDLAVTGGGSLGAEGTQLTKGFVPDAGCDSAWDVKDYHGYQYVTGSYMNDIVGNTMNFAYGSLTVVDGTGDPTKIIWDMYVTATSEVDIDLGLTVNGGRWAADTWNKAWQSFASSDVADGVIHVVPEPMTIALLGLGGLFLRRRK